MQFRVTGLNSYQLLNMDDLKLYEKSEPDLEAPMNTIRIFSNSIKNWYKQVCYSCHKERKEDGRLWNTNSR